MTSNATQKVEESLLSGHTAIKSFDCGLHGRIRQIEP
ncbi:hypothetical protein TSMEX_005361 [Taenia solium]|eukprot:TsM_000191200 transcript=TsM_000191200 gene=TsM_000191200